MKKFLICLFTYSLTLVPVLADSVMPEQVSENNRVVFSVQKQPAADAVQKQNVKNNWFFIVIQVNGKILEPYVQKDLFPENSGETDEKNSN